MIALAGRLMRLRTWLFVTILLLVTPPLPHIRAAETAAPIYVILWFDTEDYVLPASDDAALRLADWLRGEGIKATFKVVGEKARTLERRGRADVITALKQHEIGYHSNWHSVQPSPALYLANLGWDEGVAEFDRRERAGVADVTRIFGQTPSCYGQPGSSWAPQTYGAMRKWGFLVYLDAGNHVNLDDKPCYYEGILNLYKLAHVIRTNLGGPNDLRQAEDRFAAARQALRAEGGGLVSIYYHPCEFVHKEFWDGVNFRNGANPPRELWKLPPTKTAEESRVAYETFEAYVRFIHRFEDVRFITASDAARLYQDRTRAKAFTRPELKTIAAAVGTEIGFQKYDDYALAPSEVFLLLNQLLVELAAGRSPDTIKLNDTPYGPTSPSPSLQEPITTDWSQFSRTAVDVGDSVAVRGRIPGVIWLGSVPIPPEAYLVTLASLVHDRLDGKAWPETITLRPATLSTARYVAADGPNLWKWVIFPRGMRAPALMELAKRQAWTLKPAVRGSLQH